MTEPDQRLLYETAERSKSNTHRIDKLELIVDAIYSLNTNVSNLVTELKHTNENLQDHESRLGTMESQASKTIQKWKESIIGALAGILVTVVVGAIIWVIVQKGGVSLG